MSVYAVSDMHGCIDAYWKIKNYINPEDTVYCLGDCGDRGPESWNTIKMVLTDPQFIYIKGNHDDMLVKAAREAMGSDYNMGHYEAQRLLAENGGFDTLTDLLGEEKTEVWVSTIAKLPTYITYENTSGVRVFLCHAGCSIWKNEEFIPNNQNLIWDRLHYFDNSNLLGNDIVVHGHTPASILAEEIQVEYNPKEALCYADGKKYCIDSGTVWTDNIILLNLDTFESIYFNLKD